MGFSHSAQQHCRLSPSTDAAHNSHCLPIMSIGRGHNHVLLLHFGHFHVSFNCHHEFNGALFYPGLCFSQLVLPEQRFLWGKKKKKPISHPQTQREILPSQSLLEPQPKCNRADLVLQTTASWALFSHTQQAVTSADYLQETQLKPNPNTGSSDLFFPEGTGQAHLCVLKAPGHSYTHRAMQGLSSVPNPQLRAG